VKTLLGDEARRGARLRVHRRGHVVRIDDGEDGVELRARNTPFAEMMIRKLEFLAGVHPEWSIEQLVLRARDELEWGLAFLRRKTRVRRWGR
jgi:hypothetical protein